MENEGRGFGVYTTVTTHTLELFASWHCYPEYGGTISRHFEEYSMLLRKARSHLLKYALSLLENYNPHRRNVLSF
jgi:hypothetical protein